MGSTCGLLFWILCFILIVDSLDLQLSTALYQDVISQIHVNSTGVAFVDDSSLGVTSTYISDPFLTDKENNLANIDHTIQKLMQLAQHWERLLFTTGGAINLQKSHWYLVSWTWTNGKFRLATQQPAQAELELTSGYSSTPIPVPRTGISLLPVHRKSRSKFSGNIPLITTLRCPPPPSLQLRRSPHT